MTKFEDFNAEENCSILNSLNSKTLKNEFSSIKFFEYTPHDVDISMEISFFTNLNLFKCYILWEISTIRKIKMAKNMDIRKFEETYFQMLKNLNKR